jgi:hypothetical protein
MSMRMNVEHKERSELAVALSPHPSPRHHHHSAISEAAQTRDDIGDTMKMVSTFIPGLMRRVYEAYGGGRSFR